MKMIKKYHHDHAFLHNFAKNDFMSIATSLTDLTSRQDKPHNSKPTDHDHKTLSTHKFSYLNHILRL